MQCQGGWHWDALCWDVWQWDVWQWDVPPPWCPHAVGLSPTPPFPKENISAPCRRGEEIRSLKPLIGH